MSTNNNKTRKMTTAKVAAKENSSSIPSTSTKETSVAVHGQRLITKNVVGMILAPFSGGQPKSGVDLGPTHMLEEGVHNQLEELDWKVEVEFPKFDKEQKSYNSTKTSSGKNADNVSRVCSAIHDLVRKHAVLGHMPLTLGGDHSIGMATVAGTAQVYPNLGVIWVDAHADINTPQGSDSGNLHGCPVSFLTGLAGTVEGFEWLKPCIAMDRIVFIGLRDVDQPEKKIIRENKIKAFSMHHVDKYGIGKVIDLALDYLGRDSPLHLSFDVDALDPSVAPATGTPVRGGLSFREGHYICEALHETGNLVGVDIVEVNPSLGRDEEERKQTVKIGCSLVRASLGESLL